MFLWDHLRWDVALQLDVHDPWALLTAMAVRAERVRLGTCVTPLTRRRPVERSLRWDGFFPIGDAELMSPDAIADYLAGVVPPRDWDLFAALTPGHDPSEFAAVGVTWLVEGAWPVGNWVAELSGRIIEGPPR